VYPSSSRRLIIERRLRTNADWSLMTPSAVVWHKQRGMISEEGGLPPVKLQCAEAQADDSTHSKDAPRNKVDLEAIRKQVLAKDTF
jgi:hypothetical protein